MSEEKKTIVRDLGFGGLMHIPPLRVNHQVLRELANNFKLGEHRLKTGYGSFKISLKIIGDALGINASERNWGGHVLSFIINGITDYKEKKKKAIDGCLFALMIIYFHLSKNKDKKRAERPPKPWIENWNKEQIDSKKRKKSQEDSDAESESTDETQSKKKKVVVEHSSPEEDQSYHGSEIGSEDLDEFLRKNNENSAAQGEKEADLRSTEGHYVSSETMSLVEESDSEPADLNMMVVKKKTPSEALAIVSIQVCLPVSQTTAMPEFEEIPETKYEPTPLLQIEGTTKTTPEPPQELEESTPTLSPAPSKILGFTDLSQEETTTQEGASMQDEHVVKAPKTPTLLEQLENLKCYHWAVRVKSYSNERTNEFDDIGRLQAGDIYTLSKFHLASLAPKTHIEAEIFAPVCHSDHWWLWIADTRKKKFYIVDPVHNKSPTEERTVLNTFVVSWFCVLYIYSWVYDCAIYVMKWLEIFESTNIKRRKYEWDNWSQDEVDHFRVEYASRILFHDLNIDKHEAIRGSNAIRLSKLSSLLLSPYC
ncbi:hypothetical protein Ahy_A05g023331 [Arachis hypogaea]|uniref:Ubiquitin-like protease family profile domain-containing protein n=1 Tax=Arachis hypogaea TaxID=3818 RepID=A0A445D346_ARAHY|nr:hypothetical protein Ahy_A05g023331 [Arachis hypogaea]